MNPRRRSREWAVVLFVVALLAFNPPILSIFSVPKLVLGLPVLYIYIFAAWGIVIALLALNESGFTEQQEDQPPVLPGLLPAPSEPDSLPETAAAADAPENS